jgi:flagellar basal-body rod protein FlgG
MDALTISAASGLRARMETLDMLANNLANAGTPALCSTANFTASMFADADASANPTTRPAIEKHWTDFRRDPHAHRQLVTRALRQRLLRRLGSPGGSTRATALPPFAKRRPRDPDGYPVQART